MKRVQSFEERANLLRSEDRRYKSLGSVYQNKCKVYKRRWYILVVFSIVASLNNLIWNTWGPIQGTSQVVFYWDSTTITLLADWGPISFVVAVVPMCWLMDVKGKLNAAYLVRFLKLFPVVLLRFQNTFLRFCATSEVSIWIFRIGKVKVCKIMCKTRAIFSEEIFSFSAKIVFVLWLSYMLCYAKSWITVSHISIKIIVS